MSPGSCSRLLDFPGKCCGKGCQKPALLKCEKSLEDAVVDVGSTFPDEKDVHVADAKKEKGPRSIELEDMLLDHGPGYTLKVVLEHKEEGNVAYKKGEYELAAASYDDALWYLPFAVEEGLVDDSWRTSLELPLQLNMAQAFLSSAEVGIGGPGSLRNGLNACNEALAIDPNNAKGMLRRERILALLADC